MTTKVFVALLLSLVVCGCDVTREESHKLPVGSTGFTDVGNGWHTFQCTIGGTNRTFLHKWDNDRESITELAPR